MQINRTVRDCLILVILCFATYWNILDNEFVWDDSKFILDTPAIRDVTFLKGSLIEDTYEIYRPVRTLVYYGAFQLFQLNPMLYHLLSIIFHSIATLIVYFILRKLIPQAALIASLIFAVHPLHVGRVTNATASFDLVGIILLLLAFLLYLLWREKGMWWRLSLSVLVFAVGLFASEEVFTLPILIVAYEIIFQRKQDTLKSWLYWLLLGLFLVLRIGILKIGSRLSGYPLGFWTTMMSLPSIFLSYLWLVIVPWKLSPFSKVPIVTEPLWFFASLVAIAALLYVLIRFKSKESLFFGSWIVITVLPFFTPLTKMMADRYFYVPSIGAIVLLTLAIFWIQKKIKAPWLWILVVVAFAGLTVYQNTFWQDEYSLMSRGIAINPLDPQAQNNLGNWYFEHQDYEQALVHYRAAIESDPNYQRAWVNLGVLFSTVGSYNSSIFALQKAIEITPGNWIAHEKLGVTYMKMGDNATAEAYFLRAIELNPNYDRAYARLGALYGNMGRYAEAATVLQKSIELNPYYAEPYFNMGTLYDIAGQHAQAQRYYRLAAQLDPSNPQYQQRLRG